MESSIHYSVESSFEFVDDYDHLDIELEYVLENVLSTEVEKSINVCNESKELSDNFNTILLNICECNGGHKNLCSHGANYIYDQDFRELVLKNVHYLPDIIYECTDMCKCEKKKCRNRLVQYGPRKYLKIVYSKQYRSMGLITVRDIPKGAFVCEYAGELLTAKEARNNSKENEVKQKMNYILYMKECCESEQDNGEVIVTIVNPSKKGNIGRYLNHSCEPNCHIVSVRIDSPIPKIAFFTTRCIKSGEEVNFNYNEGMRSNKMQNNFTAGIPCLCGTKSCLKYLPNSE